MGKQAVICGMGTGLQSLSLAMLRQFSMAPAPNTRRDLSMPPWPRSPPHSGELG